MSNYKLAVFIKNYQIISFKYFIKKYYRNFFFKFRVKQADKHLQSALGSDK